MAVERKRAEDALRAQTELLQQIVEHIPVMLVFLDPKGAIEWGNREWTRVLGFTVEDARANDIFAALYPDPAERQRVYDSIGTRSSPSASESRSTAPSGTRWSRTRAGARGVGIQRREYVVGTRVFHCEAEHPRPLAVAPLDRPLGSRNTSITGMCSTICCSSSVCARRASSARLRFDGHRDLGGDER